MRIALLCFWIVTGCCAMAVDFSPMESNACVRTMLTAASWAPCRGYQQGDRILDFSKAEVFFSRIDTGDGWTSEGRRMAFDSFLYEMGSFNFLTNENSELGMTIQAVRQCGNMQYTNAVPALCRLVCNETYEPRFRVRAIRTLLSLADVCEASTLFVMGIYTNLNFYTRVERGTACGHYVDRLLSCNTNENHGAVIQASCVFYQQRKLDVAGSAMLDRLFVENLEGYAMSSNRLDMACFVLNHPACKDADRHDFTAITNQLLSSGQPLQWINIGGTNK